MQCLSLGAGSYYFQEVPPAGSSFVIFLYLKFLITCKHVSVHMNLVPELGIGFYGAKVTGVESSLTWMLGAELMFSARITSAPNCRASLQPIFIFF